jgi:hypothetical protein
MGMGAFLAFLVVLGVPSAFGASYAWEFESETYDYGPQLTKGPLTAHSFVLTNTGDTKIERILWGIRWYLGPQGNPDQPLDEQLFRLETPECHTLKPGASCTMTVAFAPLLIGPKYGELQVGTSREGPSDTSVQLRGRGASPRVAFTPDHLDLGSVEVGKSSVPQIITVKNEGDFPLAIQTISLTDLLGAPQPQGPFQIVGGTCQAGGLVNAGSNCTVQVTFAPSAAGAATARLALTDNAPGSPQLVELNGMAPPVATPQLGVTAQTPSPTAFVCPKGKRKAVKDGKQTCVRKRKKHRPHAHRGH